MIYIYIDMAVTVMCRNANYMLEFKHSLIRRAATRWI